MMSKDQTGRGDAIFETIVDYLIDMSDCGRISCERMTEHIISILCDQKQDTSELEDGGPSREVYQTHLQSGQ
jgi:hypothetical protein